MTTSESKGRFFYKTNRFEWIRITNRIESIRIANWNALMNSPNQPVVQPSVKCIGKETVPKIAINDTINYYFKLQHFFLVFCLFFSLYRLVMNKVAHNSLRVCCFIKLLPYILFAKNICILALAMAKPVNQQCASCIGTLTFPIRTGNL